MFFFKDSAWFQNIPSTFASTGHPMQRRQFDSIHIYTMYQQSIWTLRMPNQSRWKGWHLRHVSMPLDVFGADVRCNGTPTRLARSVSLSNEINLISGQIWSNPTLFDPASASSFPGCAYWKDPHAVLRDRWRCQRGHYLSDVWERHPVTRCEDAWQMRIAPLSTQLFIISRHHDIL